MLMTSQKRYIYMYFELIITDYYYYYFSMLYLQVPMLTIFKSFTTVLITIGDRLIFGQELSLGIGLSLCLMVLSGLVAGFNDLTFDPIGYSWMGLNVITSVLYVVRKKKEFMNERSE